MKLFWKTHKLARRFICVLELKVMLSCCQLVGVAEPLSNFWCYSSPIGLSCGCWCYIPFSNPHWCTPISYLPWVGAGGLGGPWLPGFWVRGREGHSDFNARAKFIGSKGHFNLLVYTWRIPGQPDRAGYVKGGLHKFFSEIDFLVVSDRGDWYLSDAFGPMKKYCS